MDIHIIIAFTPAHIPKKLLSGDLLLGRPNTKGRADLGNISSISVPASSM